MGKSLEELDVEAPLGAFSTFDAEVLVPEVEKLEPGGAYVEVGVDKGKSLWISRQVAKDGVATYGVDIKDNPMVAGTVFFQGDSVEISKTFEDHIGVLFIDGDHSYEGCRRDIEAWYPHMAMNGVMIFHDCDESSTGVVQAVAEFVNTHTVKSWELFKRTDRNTSMSKIQL